MEMTNIIKINFNPELTDKEREMIVSNRTNRVLTLEPKELSEQLHEAIQKAIIVVGNKSLTPDAIVVMIVELTDFIKTEYKYSKIGEILQAIKKGSYGTYLKENDVLFLSIANIAKWIRQYELDRQEVVSRQSKFEQELKEKQLEEKKVSESVKKYWADFPSNVANCSEGDKMVSIYYDNLDKLGLIDLDREEKKLLFKKSEEEIINKFRAERKSIKEIGEDIIEKQAVKRSKEKAFFIWQSTTEDIEKIVKLKLKENE